MISPFLLSNECMSEEKKCMIPTDEDFEEK